MKNGKFYIVYGLSLLLLLIIWIGPRIVLNDEPVGEIMTKRTEEIITERSPSPKEEKKIWLILNNLDSILSVIVGGVNVYLITSHYRSKQKDEPLKKQPSKIKRIFDPEPFD
jgi:heme/copper-type cytochrome/quinol oxidase subunit 2